MSGARCAVRCLTRGATARRSGADELCSRSVADLVSDAVADRQFGDSPRRAAPTFAALRSRYNQMYSSTIAPSRHFATVTIRPPPSNSPTTHVHSPDPNLMGWDLTCIGVPPVVATKAF